MPPTPVATGEIQEVNGMQAELRVRRAPVREALVGIALGLIALALAAGVIGTRGAVSSTHSNSAPAIVVTSDSRANGATQEQGHGNLRGGDDTSSLPSSGHGNLP